MRLTGTSLAAFRRSLLGWFRRSKRDMPWRRPPAADDPYRVWLSEVMLQQTRVAAAVPYYQRFLRRFPTVERLARARREDVLRLWAGLGYYSRARNLHRAAKEIVARHDGRFPREYETALSLPGIGRYTAAAVLSIAYGEPRAVLDGNVARVLARLGAIRGNLRVPRRWRRLESQAQRLLGPRAPGDWNQAMMELGATVCTPRAPRCVECPVARWCQAYRRGIAEQLPAARKKRAPLKVRLAAAVLLDREGRTLLMRQDGGLFAGMWQFPAIEVRRDARGELSAHLKEMQMISPQRTQRDTEKNWQELPTVKHSFTFREITLRPFLRCVAKLPRAKGARFVPLGRLDRLPISSATRKLARAASAFLPTDVSARGS